MSATNYECYNLSCPALRANPDFDIHASGPCDKAVEFVCYHPVVSPGMCCMVCVSTKDYNRWVKSNPPPDSDAQDRRSA
jgi:hypothetical protein